MIRTCVDGNWTLIRSILVDVLDKERSKRNTRNEAKNEIKKGSRSTSLYNIPRTMLHQSIVLAGIAP